MSTVISSEDIVPIDLKYGEDFIGLQVISVSTNRDRPVSIGNLVGWHKIGERRYPIVDFSGAEMICFTILFPYSEALFLFLGSMDKYAVFDFCSNISLLNQTVHNRSKG